MNNITALPNCKTPVDGPNQALIDLLRGLLDRAESGELQSFIGTGFTAAGLRVGAWCDLNPNVYEMLGSIVWLQHEYVHRHT